MRYDHQKIFRVSKCISFVFVLVILARSADAQPGPDCAKFSGQEFISNWSKITPDDITDCVNEMRVKDYKVALKAFNTLQPIMAKENPEGDKSVSGSMRKVLEPRLVHAALSAQFGKACERFSYPRIPDDDPNLEFWGTMMEDMDRVACLEQMKDRNPQELQRLGEYLVSLYNRGIIPPIRNNPTKEQMRYFDQGIRYAFGYAQSPSEGSVDSQAQSTEEAVPAGPAEKPDHPAPPSLSAKEPEETYMASLIREVGPWAGPILYYWALLILWLMGARIVIFFVGRRLGVVDPSWFRFWLWIWPWRFPYQGLFVLIRWWRRLKFGQGANSEWAGLLETMVLTFKKGDRIYLGRLAVKGIAMFQSIALRGLRHIAIVAGSGSGKTTQLMTILGTLHKKASAFVVDCDGQIISALGNALIRAGHRVVLLDPYHLVKGFAGGRWNPLDEITRAVEQHGHDAAVRFAQKLAEALIRELESTNAWVYKEGRNFMAGLILYVWLYEPEEKRNIVRVRQLLTMGLPEKAGPNEDPFKALIREMKEKPDFGGVIAGAASVISSSQGQDGKNHPRTTCIDQTDWLDQPEMAAISTASDMCGEDLKLTNTCVFLAAPLTDIQGKLSSWVRAYTMMTMYAFENIPGKLKIPCLFALDEMPSLGKIDVLATSAPAFRKYGIRLVTVTQDLQRLQKAYPQDWRGFLGQAECTIWMGLGLEDGQTLKFLSEEVLGKRIMREKIEGSHWLLRWLGISKVPARYQKIERLLMTPQQLSDFLNPEDGNIIITRFGKRPLRLKHGPYYSELPFWAFDPDPQFGESFLRARVRELFSWLRPPKVERTENIRPFETPVFSSQMREGNVEPPALESEQELFVVGHEVRPALVEIPVPKAAKPSVFKERFEEHFHPQFGKFPDTGLRMRIYKMFKARLEKGGKYYDLCHDFLAQFDPSRSKSIDEREEVLRALCEDFKKHFMKQRRVKLKSETE